MRLSLFIFILLFSFTIQAQTPVGVANTFDLSETNGFKGKHYVQLFKQTASGKIYAKEYFGGVNIIGNNTSKPLLGYKGYIDNNGSITEVGNEVWIYDGNKNIIIIKNDSVVKVLKDNDPSIPAGTHRYDNRSFFFNTIDGKLDISEFKNNKWVKIKRVQLHPNIKQKDIDFITFKRNGIVLDFSTENKTNKLYLTDVV